MISSVKQIIDRMQHEKARRGIPPTQALDFLRYEPRRVLANFVGVYREIGIKEMTIYVVLN